MLDLKVESGCEAKSDSYITRPSNEIKHYKKQMSRLAKLAKKHRNGQVNKIDWLDRLTFREIELINEREKRASNFLYLSIDFPETLIDETLVSKKFNNNVYFFTEKI